MIQALVRTANRLLDRWQHAWIRNGAARKRFPEPVSSAQLERLERIILTDEVSRTLFDEYASHRKSARGKEETGWVLLGLRQERDVIVLATLPAGAERNAGVAHVQFNDSAQALASRIVRQHDRRLTIVGVVHTHPGSLRHPSEGDYRGDIVWVDKLRGREGIFGIGTADARGNNSQWMAADPESGKQVLGDLCVCWYALGHGERSYRRLPVHLTLGPDLAGPLHRVWSTLEMHAESLERLCRQLAKLSFQVVGRAGGAMLVVDIHLAEPEGLLRVILDGKAVRYLLLRSDEVMEINPDEDRLERAVFQILAELSRQD